MVGYYVSCVNEMSLQGIVSKNCHFVYELKGFKCVDDKIW